MKKPATSPQRSLPFVKTGMAIAALCLAGQVLSQAAPPVPAYGATAYPAGAASTPADTRHAHREVSRAPVKPPHYPSNPQPPIPTQR